MKRLFIAVAVLGLMLAAPATADDADTRIVVNSWRVELNERPVKEPLEPGATFTHCPGDDVTRIEFRGRMLHPSRKGVEYDIDWRHRGEYTGGFYGADTRKNGKVRESIGTEGGQGMGNGKWSAHFKRNGHRIGKSWIKLRTAAGPAC